MATSEFKTSFVTDYIEKTGPTIHPAFAIGSNFNQTKSKYEAKDKHQEFVEALEQYKVIDGHNLSFDPAKCSWAEVVEELNKAHHAAYLREQDDKTTTSRVGSFLTNASKILQPGLAAIPDELCILHGGLALMFNLAHRQEKLQQRIVDVFGHIPEIIAMACTRSQSFPDDTKLHSLLDQLKVTLFETIPSLADKLRPKPVDIKRPKMMLTKVISPFRGFKAEDLLSRIERSARLLEAYARDLQDRLVVDIYHDTDYLRNKTDHVHVQVSDIRKSISDVSQDVRGISAQCKDIVGSHIEDLKDFCARQIDYALESKNGLFQMLTDFVSVLQYVEPEPNMSRSSPPCSPMGEPSPELFMDLLGVLDVDPSCSGRDLSIILRETQEFDRDCKSLLATILANPQFQRWLMADDTDLVYIEGRLDSSKFGKTSPISYICANVAFLLSERSETITVHFFCGQHVGLRDDLRGPRGLIRSLLAQVLEIWRDAPLTTLNTRIFEDSPEIVPMDVLCQTFRWLMEQVPSYGTVYCIIDDLHRYEQDQWADDYITLLRMLEDITSGDRNSGRVKVLITCPTKSVFLRQYFLEHLIELTERVRVMGRGRYI